MLSMGIGYKVFFSNHTIQILINSEEMKICKQIKENIPTAGKSCGDATEKRDKRNRYEKLGGVWN